MDEQIQFAQVWLNETYAGHDGWVEVPTDGMTGWDTIYGLRRGLQAELGISPLTSGFGPATTAAFKSQIVQIDENSNTSTNLLSILSGALFCKGYSGIYHGGVVSFEFMADTITQIRGLLGLSSTAYVDVKLMASLLSMDAYEIPFFGDGTSTVREVQQWLNGMYVGRQDFAIVPCDGIFSRQVQTALLYALQYEFGMADGTANGNFGNGTRAGLKSQAPVGPGSTDDGGKHFVHLYQGAMRFNGYDVPFDGTFGADTEAKTADFQEFMAIPVDHTGSGDQDGDGVQDIDAYGAGGYSTWCSLLVSSGDTTVRTTGLDTNRQLLAAEVWAIQEAGYTHVGRYTVGADKFITAPELSAIKSAGLRLFPIHQRYNNSADLMTYDAGVTQGREAIERCRTLGLPADSTVYFSVDFDPVGETIKGPVLDFFNGVNDAMGAVINDRFTIGVYGTRNVCQIVTDEGKAKHAFVAGESTGWSGNLGFSMPTSWNYNQIVEVTESFPDVGTISIDHVLVATGASAVDLTRVTPPPLEADGSDTATGFDAVFEWVVRAEVAVEEALTSMSGPVKSFEGFAIRSAEFILDALRQPKYGDDTYSGLWGKYLIIKDDTDPDAIAARRAAKDAVDSLTPSKPTTNRDAPHWAATALGYMSWGVPTGTASYGLGDLGGWLLDLLSAYGVYSRENPSADMMSWMTGNVGVNDDSGFGYDDIVADADAWLIAKALREESNLSAAMRDLYQLTSAQRVARFYDQRFGSSEGNVASQFQHLADGIDVGSVDNFPFGDDLLRQAAGNAPLPSQDEADVCGRAYARVLARLGQ